MTKAARHEATHEYLIQELTAIHTHPHGWHSERAAALLRVAAQQFGALARREGAEPADAVSEAWRVWREEKVLSADDAWAYTASYVRHALRDANEAQRMLTSEQGIRRQGAENFVASSEDGLDALTTPDHAAAAAPATHRTAAAHQIADLITSHGYDTDLAADVVDAMFDLGAKSSSPAAAADNVSREKDIPAALGITHDEWKALTRLLYGSPRGAVGLLEAEVTGGEPDQKHVRLTLARYDRVAAAV